MNMLGPLNSGHLESLCPECFRVIPADLKETATELLLSKLCPVHGTFETPVATDLAAYKTIAGAPRQVKLPPRFGSSHGKGCPDDCGLCPAHDQHTCLAILEITSRCELGCPICLSSSCVSGEDLSIDQVKVGLSSLISQEGRVAPLQLSGGEPTLHPQLSKIIATADSLGFTKIEIDTNGIRLAEDPSFAERLREAGLTGVYLQMDSLQPDVCRRLRGKDLVDRKLKAIENCQTADLQVVLSAMVVPGLNDHLLWEMVLFGVEKKVTGVNFQSLTLSGRVPGSLFNHSRRFTQTHFGRSLEEQSGGTIKAADFTPIPCPDPRCGALAYVLIRNGRLMPLGRIVEAESLLGPTAGLSDWGALIRQLDEGGCGCIKGCVPDNDDPFLALGEIFVDSDFFSIGYHGMMDAYDFDLERARRCCVHELTPEGRLIPFCLYNVKYRGGK